jgi:hypothetical protein
VFLADAGNAKNLFAFFGSLHAKRGGGVKKYPALKKIGVDYSTPPFIHFPYPSESNPVPESHGERGEKLTGRLTMEHVAYQAWSELHDRIDLGEILRPKDQAEMDSLRDN